RAAAAARRHDVRPQVAQRAKTAVAVLQRGEAAAFASCDVLEEHALDRVVGAVGEDLLRRRLHQARAHAIDTLGAEAVGFPPTPIPARADQGAAAPALPR